ncbi:DNA polymerase I,DNA polymerase I,DNA polymerase I - 3'-5' exonuclease and polymerase domains,DNA polymerase I,DNA polymerase family A [Chlamydia serpentis]|uniref:DNA polymerase I n=1 Tax=Chlamydia serpentis TaxID=1967782 RepID=A0A2R8FBM9_9CHLA|nr:DNA polymerase I [Chlamydia serpentis]SPN73732.1 DNA polymerase I,DNA polymerase I,DNA polymerase I - 3'-5' exonuclease and polymerase domains,DNA polymerase I,DNA polymerase family A [Chlamydia serpentis]
MKKLFVLDASGFIFRAYFALPEMKNPEGLGTQAVFGFIRSVNKLIKEFSPEYMVAVFDGPNNKQSRQEIYPDYKSNRKKKFEDIPGQIALVKKYCSLIGLAYLEKESVEADDVIASVAKQAILEDYEVCICTSDKDLLQLVDHHIVVWNPWKDQGVIGVQQIVDHYGIPPNNIPDYLALVGDASDNIPGVPGCGPKRATTLLQQFGSIEGLLENLKEVKGLSQTMLSERRETLELSKKLALLDCNISIPLPIQSLTFPQSIINQEELIHFYIQQGFKTLVTSKQTTFSKVDVEIVKDIESLANILELFRSGSVAFAAAYVGKHLPSLQPQGLALAQGSNTFFISLENENTPIINLLKSFFLREDLDFYGYNIKRDCHALRNVGIVIREISCDLALAEHLINGGSKTSLQSLLVNHGLTQDAHRFAKEWGNLGLPISCLPEQPEQYFGELVSYLPLLRESILEKVNHKGLTHILREIEMPLEKILFSMERTGMPVDIEELAILEEILEIELATLTEEIFHLSGKPFNIKSPKQLSDVLYNQLGLRPIDKAKSTRAEILEALRGEHEIIEKILAFRTIEKLLSTYVKALPRQVNPITQRIHPSFDQIATVTGRLACRDPNLQNIPIRSDRGMLLRKAFRVNQKNNYFLSADYSQIELRFLAHFSQDESLKIAFESGEDVHVFTASQVFRTPLEEVSKQQRIQAKTVNFGIVYGQQAFGLAKVLKISIAEAQELIQAYFSRYPGVARFVEETIEQAAQDLRVTTMLGRERIIDNWNEFPGSRAASGRFAVNTRIQGSAAELIKLAMINISQIMEREKMKSRLLLQIHDELLFEVPQEEMEIMQLLVKEKMESAMTLSVPIAVNILIGKNWAEC